MSVEDRNYYNDSRVRASGKRWWKQIDFSGMKALVTYYKEDEEVTEWVGVSFEVCHICEGRGSHINPSIDAGGLTANDFAEDPDFLEDYMSGTYDVPCYLCKGDKVVPVAEDEKIRKEIEKQQEIERQIRAEQLAERLWA